MRYFTMALPINIQRLLDSNPEYKITSRGVEKAVGGGKTELIVSIKGLAQDGTTKQSKKADVVKPAPEVVEEEVVTKDTDSDVEAAPEVEAGEVVEEAPTAKKSYYKKKVAAK